MISQYLKELQVLEDLSIRRTDNAFIEIVRELAVSRFVLMSPLICGSGSGLFNQLSIQIPTLVRSALKSKTSEIVGDDPKQWGNIHVADSAALYELLVANILRGAAVSTGQRGIYFTVSERTSVDRYR